MNQLFRGIRLPSTVAGYWSTMCVASVAGANLGDCLGGVPWGGATQAFLLLGLVFAGPLVFGLPAVRGHPACYWAAVVIVRAIATTLADLIANGAGRGVAGASAALTILLTGLLAVRHVTGMPASVRMPWRMDPMYWPCLLVAGVLGTELGDGLGHAIQPVTVGYPFAAVVTGLLALSVVRWGSLASSMPVAGYWLAIVAIRTWGTEMADILTHVFSLAGSLLASLSVLAALAVLPGPGGRPHSAHRL